VIVVLIFIINLVKFNYLNYNGDNKSIIINNNLY
jgi:hypothetical protein